MLEANVDNTNETQWPAEPAGVDDSRLNQSLHQVQELTRSIDSMLKSAAANRNVAVSKAPELISAERPIEGQSHSLPELDQMLAQDLDDLLKSDVQTIDTVLNNVFEEQAVVVQKLDEPVAPVPSALETLVAVDLSTRAQTEDVAQNRWNEHVAYAPEEELGTLDSHEMTGIAGIGLRDQTDEEPPAWVFESKRVNVFAATLSMLAWPLFALLHVLNFPLRLVPARWRTVVDWVALTLLLWAPLVWMFVLFAT